MKKFVQYAMAAAAVLLLFSLPANAFADETVTSDEAPAVSTEVDTAVVETMDISISELVLDGTADVEPIAETLQEPVPEVTEAMEPATPTDDAALIAPAPVDEASSVIEPPLVEGTAVVTDPILAKTEPVGKETAEPMAFQNNAAETPEPATEAAVLALAAPASALPGEPDIVVPWENHDLAKGETKTSEVIVTSTKGTSKADIVFVFDTTGSMYSAKTWAMNTIATFTANLLAAGTDDLHWGLYAFGDYRLREYNYDLPLGAYTTAELQAAFNGITAYYGGDAPEDATFALMDAATLTTWRMDSQRFLILFTDAATKERPSLTVGGYAVTAAGLSSLLADKGIDASLHAVNWYGDYLYTDDGTTAISIGDFAAQIGKTLYFSENETELLSQLSVDLIKPWDYSYTVSAVYESDGAPSSDIILTLTPGGFSLAGDATGKFSLSATAVADPARKNDRTIVTITYLVNGVPVNGGVGATQVLTFSAAAIAIPTTPTTPIVVTPVETIDTPTVAEPAVPVKLVNLTQPAAAEPTTLAQTEASLPQTGDHSSILLISLGCLMLAGCVGLYDYKKKAA